VNAVTTTTGTFHLLPEVGWMYSDDFAFAAQARVEFIAQEQAKCSGQVQSSIRPGSPTTKAFAAMGRGIWYTDLSSGGNLRLSLSGDIGGGYVRLPVKPIGKCDYNNSLIENSSVAKTDTRPIGPFLIGASGGMIYNISRHFALVLDVRVLSGLPHTGAVVEGGFSAQLAFGGVAGPASAGEEGEEGEEGEGGEGGERSGSVNEAPPPPAEPSNDANDSVEE
jgi:hypothetical protein